MIRVGLSETKRKLTQNTLSIDNRVITNFLREMVDGEATNDITQGK